MLLTSTLGMVSVLDAGILEPSILAVDRFVIPPQKRGPRPGPVQVASQLTRASRRLLSVTKQRHKSLVSKTQGHDELR